MAAIAGLTIGDRDMTSRNWIDIAHTDCKMIGQALTLKKGYKVMVSGPMLLLKADQANSRAVVNAAITYYCPKYTRVMNSD
jgi:hypothetical protein